MALRVGKKEAKMKEVTKDWTNESVRGVFEGVLGQSPRKTCPSLFLFVVR